MHVNGDITNTDSSKGKQKTAKQPNKSIQTEQKERRTTTSTSEESFDSHKQTSDTKKSKRDQEVTGKQKALKNEEKYEDGNSTFVLHILTGQFFMKALY